MGSTNDNGIHKATAEASLEKLVGVSEEILQMSSKAINYQLISDFFLDLSGARFVAFNLYDPGGKQFATVSTSGLSRHIEKISSLLGFQLAGKQWPHDPERNKKISKETLTRFSNLHELTGTRIPEFIISHIEHLFAIGEVYVLKIMRQDKMLGDFTFVMPRGKTFSEESSAGIFSRQLGLLLARKQAEEMLQKKSAELEYALKQQRVLSEVALTLNTLDDFDQRIGHVLKLIGEHMGISRIYIFENNNSETYTSNTHEWCKPGISAEIDNLQDVPFSAIPLWEERLKTKGIVHADDIRSLDAGTQEVLEAQGVKSILAYALNVKGRFFGFIGFDECTEYKQWSDSEMDMLGTISGIVSHAYERRLMEQTIHDEVRKANDANRAKSEFLANMSHEIRTPMNAILGFSEALYHRTTSPENKKMVESILSGGKLLLSLLNDILDLAKIEAGKLELFFTPVSPHMILEETRLLFSSKAVGKGLEFVVAASGKVPQVLEMDETRTKQILFNLVSNAIKFTHHGQIVVSADFEAGHESSGTLVLRVTDTGIGIAKDQAGTIFEDFSQLHTEATRKYEGTGLGLSICKRLVEKMNGHISLESEPGRGSEFTVIIPRLAISAPSPAQRIEINPKESIQFEKSLILVVDDVRSDIEMVESLLYSLGLDVMHSLSGREAMEMIADRLPALILLDTRMPEMNGYEMLQVLKNHPDYKHIPVVAYSATVPGYSKNPLSRLFNGNILKPVSRKTVIEELARHLPYSIVQEAPSMADTAEVVDLTRLPADIVKNIPHITEELNNTFLPLWSQIKDQLVIFKIEDFGKKLDQMAISYQFTFLQQYAQKLIREADMFDIEAMRETLGNFPYICEQIAAAQFGHRH